MREFMPIRYRKENCIGCLACVEACQVDVLAPGKEKGDTPRVLYPSECWYCGCCVMECPMEDAISLHHPLMNQVKWVEKKSLLKEKGRE